MKFDYHATIDMIVDDDHIEFHPNVTILLLIRELSSLPLLVSFFPHTERR